uniref:Uncharacterized protein n=1 Tax=Neovison vison TaxID=452646 RepID=A0A8C7BB30_NEOVI
ICLPLRGGRLANAPVHSWEAQAAACSTFPLGDLVSYFFRLWFGERNQHSNDFFSPRSH